MPVCPHDWRKHSCSFCPAESCCIMGVLKALGSERACLTKPWWLAADRRGCLWAGCQKLIFFSPLFFLWGAVAAAWQRVRFWYHGERARAGAEICTSFVRVQRAALRGGRSSQIGGGGNVFQTFVFLSPFVRLKRAFPPPAPVSLWN